MTATIHDPENGIWLNGQHSTVITVEDNAALMEIY